MTDNPIEPPSRYEEIPEAKVRPPARFRIIWLIPILAVLIGIWLTVKSRIESGPTVTITFKSAEGLQAGKTKIKYKDVEVGQVETICLNDDLSAVEITASMVKEMEDHLSEHTRFWVVRARLAAGEVSGIGTILSGAYIGMDPGQSGRISTNFEGLESPPVVTLDMPGSYYTLHANQLGSLDLGSPVYFRQIKVGQVVNYAMNTDGTAIDIKIFIQEPNNQRVLENTRFWNASGFEASLDSRGLRINTDSLVSLLLGGVAFETPANEVPGPRAAEGRTFFLFPSHDKIQELVYSEKMYLLAFFDESVRGLAKGANVEFRGIKVGEVVDIKLEFDPQELVARVPVLMVVEPERLSLTATPDMTTEDMVLKLIEKGLRAQLRTAILLTGQLYVNLTMAGEPSSEPITYVSGHPVIPTISGPTEEILARVTQFLERLEALPIEQIGEDLQASLKDIRFLVGSRDLPAALAALRKSLDQINRFVGTLNKDTAPQLAAVLDAAAQALSQTQATMAAAEDLLGSDAPLNNELQGMIEELAKAGRSVSALADYLERHPEALIFGKGAPPR